MSSSSSLVYRVYRSIDTVVYGGPVSILLALLLSYGYSSWVLSLFNGLLASPAQSIAVALLGLALFPQARARLSFSSGCNSSGAPLAGGKESAGSSAAGGDNSSTLQLRHLNSSRCRSFKLARPPFSADLSCGLSSPSYSCSSSSSSSKGRRRRLPRVSIELTPLPRLSLEFQQRSSRRRLSTSSVSSLDDCSLFPSSSSQPMHGSVHWQPSMTRIRSGHDLQLLSQDANCSSLLEQQQMLWAAGGSLQDPPSVGEATESLGHSPLVQGLEHLGEVVNETHLLQVGAMLGEASSRAALVAQEAGGPVGHPSSFYGSADTDDFLEPWDLLMSESNPNVLYWAWRRPLRGGLYMYMTRSVFLGASPAELRAFMNDDAYRVVWDNAMLVLRPLASASMLGESGTGSASSNNAAVEAMAAALAARTSGAGGCSTPSCGAGAAGAAAADDTAATGAAAAGSSSTLASAASLSSPFANAASSSSDQQEPSCASSSSNSSSSEVLAHEQAVMQALVQFPKPMASRSYIYARRVWHRPSDGGCYCLSKACSFPDPQSLPSRAVAVGDYVSGCVIRTPAAQLLPAGYSGPAAEVFMVYFEDSHVRPGLANLGIKKGLWPLVQKTDKALRVYQAGAAANMHLQPDPSGPAVTCQLQSSMSTPSPGLSRQGSLQAYGPAGCASEPCSPAAAGDGSRSSSVCTATGEAFAATAAAGEEEEVSSSSRGPLHQSGTECTAAAEEAHAAHAACPQTSKPHNSSSSSSKKGLRSSSWWWWSTFTGTVCGALKGSGQLLAAASVALWRSHTRLALMVPTLEWRLLHWLLQRLSAPSQLLLGAPAGAASSGRSGPCCSSSSKSKLRSLSSHPIGDWAHPGLLQRLQQSSSGPSLLRVASHPLTVEELQAADSDTPPAAPSRVCGSSGRELAVMHFGGHSSCCCCHANQQGGGGAAAVVLAEGSEIDMPVTPDRCSSLGGAGPVQCGGCGSSCGVCATSLQLLQERCSPEPLLGSDWPSAAYSAVHSMHSMCRSSLHAQHSHQGHRGMGEESSSHCGSVSGAASSCGCSCCCCNSSCSHHHCRIGAGGACASAPVSEAAAAAGLGASVSYSGSSSGGCSGSRVSGGGRRQRRVVIRLMQAASVRLAHKLLSALE